MDDKEIILWVGHWRRAVRDRYTWEADVRRGQGCSAMEERVEGQYGTEREKFIYTSIHVNEVRFFETSNIKCNCQTKVNKGEARIEKSGICTAVALRYYFIYENVGGGEPELRFVQHPLIELEVDIPKEDKEEELTPETVDYEDDVEYLRSLDPKEWKSQDHYKVLGIPNIRYKATDDIIKTAYRKKVLKQHPDKRKALGEEIKTDDDYFNCITMVYETLGNISKRRAYDSVDPQFDNDLPCTSDKKKDFYKTFTYYFDLNSRWSEKTRVPKLGTENSTKEEVEHFYSFWYDFKSWREYSYEDEEDKDKCQDRDERRYVDKLNKAERLRKKKEEIKLICGEEKEKERSIVTLVTDSMSSNSNISTCISHNNSSEGEISEREDEISENSTNISNVQKEKRKRLNSLGSGSDKGEIKRAKEMDTYHKELVRSLDTLTEQMKKMEAENKRLMNQIHQMQEENKFQMVKLEEKITGKDQEIQKLTQKLLEMIDKHAEKEKLILKSNEKPTQAEKQTQKKTTVEEPTNMHEKERRRTSANSPNKENLIEMENNNAEWTTQQHQKKKQNKKTKITEKNVTEEEPKNISAAEKQTLIIQKRNEEYRVDRCEEGEYLQIL
ncbi:dnaJ homolog subfamily C member 2-like [Diabrotica virgifera virgifera]|uniref:J domain-containing protein n=1 Tax=Diabrotica virgifera virgifera TaxID=50390 RepID=A0ABM5K4T8_DIAVI|nr:dnaJ homolog subfamily C member 2-like [Diabrotica virgifera virgifera]